MKKGLSFFLFFIFIPGFFIALEAKPLVLFSPEDKPTKKLLELINNAQKKIHAAVYMITDKTIATALVKAKKDRGVDVQVITDKVTVDSNFGKGKLLREQGIMVYVYSPQNKASSKISQKVNSNQKIFNVAPLMHNKFALFDDKLVLTGSFNWTRSANQKNRENVIIIDEKEVIDKYQKEFLALKEKCLAPETKKIVQEDTKLGVKELYTRFFDIIKRTIKVACSL